MGFTNKLLPSGEILMIPAQSDTGKFKFIYSGELCCKDELFPQVVLYKKDNPLFKAEPIVMGSASQSVSNINPFICSKDSNPMTIYWTSKSILETITNVALEGIDPKSYYAFSENDYICVSENKSWITIELDKYVIQIGSAIYGHTHKILEEGSTLRLYLDILSSDYEQICPRHFIWAVTSFDEVLDFFKRVKEAIRIPESIIKLLNYSS